MRNKLWMAMCIFMLCLSCVACEKKEESPKEPELSQMRAICELATMECYYHNVAKYYEEDAEGFLIFKKDKNFWVEYSGIITLGIDASKLNFKIKGDIVEITIPEAKVLDCKVDPDSLTEDSVIIAEKSAKVKAEDQQKAFEEAQDKMLEVASKDDALLANAQQRAQCLIQEYVENVGEVTGVDYQIEWNYIEEGSKE